MLNKLAKSGSDKRREKPYKIATLQVPKNKGNFLNLLREVFFLRYHGQNDTEVSLIQIEFLGPMFLQFSGIHFFQTFKFSFIHNKAASS